MAHVGVPGAKYVVQGTLKHDGVTYAPDSEFTSEDGDLLSELHRLGAIRLPGEVDDPEVVAARQLGLQQENEALKAELAALKNAQASPKSRRGKAEAADSSEGSDSGEESEGGEASSEAETAE